MQSDHPYLEDIPAYALGALDPSETARLEAHLAACAQCQAELAVYRGVSENLLTAVPPVAPPAVLRRKLQGRLPGAARKPAQPAWRWSIPIPQFALALGVLLLLAFNLYSIMQVQAMARQQTRLADELATSQTTIAMLAYPETEALPIHGGTIAGELLLDKERNLAILLAWNLPKIRADQSFQIWLIDPQGGRTSAGVFSARDDLPFTSVPILSTGNLSGYIGIGVTVEPAGGSPQPTGQRLFKVDF